MAWRCSCRCASRPLGRLFDQWIHGFLLPEVRLTWQMADNTHLAIKVEQLGGTFDFPLTLTIYHADGCIELFPLVVTKPVGGIVVPVPAPVRRVDTRDDTSLLTVKR